MAEQSVYDLMGGEAGIRSLTQRFYEIMDQDIEAQACRDVHPEDLSGSEEKLFEYFTGWFGGPPLYTEKRGPPMLRARHLHAPIGEAEIAGWMHCFIKAWNEQSYGAALGPMVLPRVEGLALHMRNR